MRVNHKRKAVYHHVMKTGGTTLSVKILSNLPELLQSDNTEKEKWVWVMGMHGTYTELYNRFPEIYEAVSDYYHFAFVRNPFSHAVSMYFHLTSPNTNHPGIINSKTQVSFKKFLRELYRPQSVSTFEDEKFINSEFYKFEDYEKEVRRLLRVLKYSDNCFKNKLPRTEPGSGSVNETIKNIYGVKYPTDYRVMYDADDIDYIINKCKDYINKFNYEI